MSLCFWRKERSGEDNWWVLIVCITTYAYCSKKRLYETKVRTNDVTVGWLLWLRSRWCHFCGIGIATQSTLHTHKKNQWSKPKKRKRKDNNKKVNSDFRLYCVIQHFPCKHKLEVAGGLSIWHKFILYLFSFEEVNDGEHSRNQLYQFIFWLPLSYPKIYIYKIASWKKKKLRYKNKHNWIHVTFTAL